MGSGPVRALRLKDNRGDSISQIAVDRTALAERMDPALLALLGRGDISTGLRYGAGAGLCGNF